MLAYKRTLCLVGGIALQVTLSCDNERAGVAGKGSRHHAESFSCPADVSTISARIHDGKQFRLSAESSVNLARLLGRGTRWQSSKNNYPCALPLPLVRELVITSQNGETLTVKMSELCQVYSVAGAETRFVLSKTDAKEVYHILLSNLKK